MQHWARYCSKKFASVESSVVQGWIDDIKDKPFSSSMSVMDDDITLEEVREAIKHLKNHRAPGSDLLQIELFKHSNIAMEVLWHIFRDSYRAEVFPNDFVLGEFIALYKKGSKNVMSNYRMICLLNHSYKAFVVVLLRRLNKYVDVQLQEFQNGFRCNRGTRDNLFVVRSVIEQILQSDMCGRSFVFIDYAQAFDTVSHQFLEFAMLQHSVSQKMVRVILSLYASAKARMKGCSGQFSKSFPVRRGVLQGCILSPLLFVMVLDSIWKKVDQRLDPSAGMFLLPTWNLRNLAYADDLLITNDNISHSEDMLNILDEESKLAAMEINIAKTKHMYISKKQRVSHTTELEAEQHTSKKKEFVCPICDKVFDTARGLSIHKTRWCTGDKFTRARLHQRLDFAVKQAKREELVKHEPQIQLSGKAIENVHSFVYVGGLIMSYGGSLDDIDRRIALAQTAFNQLAVLWKSSKISRHLKMRLFVCRVISTLLYGCESWFLSKKSVKRIRGFVARCLSKIIKQDPHIIIADGWPGFDPILEMEKRRWSWLGHVLRMDSVRFPRRSLTFLSSEKMYGSILDACPWSLDKAATIAKNREMWRKKFRQRVTITAQFPSGK